MRPTMLMIRIAVAMALAPCWAVAQENVRLALPKTVYAAPGIECNLYFDNVVLVLDPGDYTFDVNCSKGVQLAECWRYAPGADDAGDYPLTLVVRNGENETVAEGATTVRVAPAGAGSGGEVSMLLIGDSLTHASVYSQHLLDLCASDGNPRLTLVGSHGIDEPLGANRHEGYGGWTAKRFATQWTGVARTGPYAERGSPFLYETPEGSRVLDFKRYCDDVNGGKLPDFVSIFLGCNDTFGADEGNIENVIDDMLVHMDALVAMIHGASPAIRIGLIQPVPPTTSQDAFGADYGTGQTRWQYRRNQHRAVERMAEHYAQAPNVTFIPAYVNLDCVHNFPAASQPVNARNDETVIRQNNGVHPAETGYRQIGDSIYGWMKNQVMDHAKPEETSP
ncbi:MAG TPA: GDSL-type esterase/lipase family protein [Candidatus Hydrogenedentes bacterium]|nr:GDSL-type esterase/lipase family protein [Candidatus Hydrogenedentota bacterium]HQM47864.1 GDSL-type esterase/lipase family protein [Candidatus Hydrogenedentota bacterium]